MNRLITRPVSASARALICLSALFATTAGSANAGTVNIGTWYEFSFTNAGVAAKGCAPADPAGAFCTPSSGTPTTFADAPAWTFVAPVGGAVITLVDAFTTLEAFQIFDAGVSLGVTSAPNPLGDCGDDPAACLLDPNASKGTFFVAAGARSLTIVPTLSPDGLGSAFFLIEAAGAAVPEPATWLLTGAAMLALGICRRKERV